jgi:RNA polymerase sigma-70 factor (ECF subfamily)
MRQSRPDVEASTALVDQARTSRAAFAEIYRLYVDRVFRFCRANTATVEQAEDLTEETFIKALDALVRPAGQKGRYEDRGLPFSSWLLRIAANTIRDAWRSRKEWVYSLDRAPEDDEEGEGDPLGDRLVDRRQVDPAAAVDDWDRAARLRACLALLPADYRQLLQLRFWDDCGWDDVARCMGRSAGAVKKLYARALRMLTILVQEEQLHARLGVLPEEQQQAVRFRYLEGHDPGAVARLMGRSVGSVEWLLEGALKTLWEGMHTNE